VVATWPLIFVSMVMDLMGRARGSGTGRGGMGPGHRWHGRGTINPCAGAGAFAAKAQSAAKIKQIGTLLAGICSLLMDLNWAQKLVALNPRTLAQLFLAKDLSARWEIKPKRRRALWQRGMPGDGGTTKVMKSQS
jgi:hypothetical protein